MQGSLVQIGDSGLGVTFRIGRILAQTQLGAWPDFGSQSYSKAPGDL